MVDAHEIREIWCVRQYLVSQVDKLLQCYESNIYICTIIIIIFYVEHKRLNPKSGIICRRTILTEFDIIQEYYQYLPKCANNVSMKFRIKLAFGHLLNAPLNQ